MRFDGFTGIMGLLIVGAVIFVAYQAGREKIMG